MNEALADSDDGVKVGGELVLSIRFADDQAMVANSEESLQHMMKKVDETSEVYGMKLNTKKTKNNGDL